MRVTCVSSAASFFGSFEATGALGGGGPFVAAGAIGGGWLELAQKLAGIRSLGGIQFSIFVLEV
jgi:hypothetical protein